MVTWCAERSCASRFENGHKPMAEVCNSTLPGVFFLSHVGFFSDKFCGSARLAAGILSLPEVNRKKLTPKYDFGSERFLIRFIDTPMYRTNPAQPKIAGFVGISPNKRIDIGCCGRKESAFSQDEYAYSYNELSTDDVDDSVSEDNPSQPQGTSAPYYVEASALVASGNRY